MTKKLTLPKPRTIINFLKTGITRLFARARHYAKRHPRNAGAIGVVLVLLVASATVGYLVGAKHQQDKPGLAETVSAPTSPLPADRLANRLPNRPPMGPTDNSGFLRLNGDVVSTDKTSIAIRLKSGAIVKLSIDQNTKYFTTDNKAKPIAEIPPETYVLVASNITQDGFFNATNIRVIPKPKG